MGNHSIDCEFCGKDRRLTGNYCCKEYEEAEKKKREEMALAEEKVDKFLKLYGFTGYLSYYSSKKDVAEMLERLIKSGELKPRQPPVEVGQKWRSTRNGREVTILELKEVDGYVAARVEGGRWLTVRSKSVVGYRPVM